MKLHFNMLKKQAGPETDFTRKWLSEWVSKQASKQASKEIINKLFEDTLDLNFPTGVFLCCYALTLT